MSMKVLIAIIVVIVLAGGGFFFWQSRSATTAEIEEVTPTPEEEPTPTPEEFERSEFDIEILNGSGIAGEAGRAQELLEDEDFIVISTGNAESYDYEETVIQANGDVPDEWVDELISVLERKYTVQTRIDDIEGDTDAQVVIIVGQLDETGESMVVEEEEVDEPTPTPEDEEDEEPTQTPTPTPTPEE